MFLICENMVKTKSADILMNAIAAIMDQSILLGNIMQ